ncbi:MAG: hypothetical protein JO104_06915 [Candidatus Eremiobacteraeota bacterium]|nr:hypothetical protein [Candidatus Eremiobacteraeota bacterium]
MISIDRIQNSAKHAVGISLAAAMLAGCSSPGYQATSLGGSAPQTSNDLLRYPTSHSSNPGVLSGWPERGSAQAARRGIVKPNVNLVGIYGSINAGAGLDINGYNGNNLVNAPPACQVPGNNISNIATDAPGDLIDPDGGTGKIIVYKGPGLCGPLGGATVDPFGRASDAASRNALAGKIAVGNVSDIGGAPGSVSVCTLAINPCAVNLHNPRMFRVAGVAMDLAGNCWADAVDANNAPWLTEFPGCTGGGVTATGFIESDYGGLDIDALGQLIAIDVKANTATVYKGCPACAIVKINNLLPGGTSLFGHFNHAANMFATADYAFNQIDEYSYVAATGTLTYVKSFNNGFAPPPIPPVVGVAWDPRSRE